MLLLDTKYALKLCRKQNERVGISEELRGWSWDQPPVEPPIRGIELGVSDIASRYCASMRDIYLRYVLGVKAKPTLRMLEGKVYHEILRFAVEKVKKIVYTHNIIEGFPILKKASENIDEEIEKLIAEIFNANDMELNNSEFSRIFEKSLKLWRFLILKYAASVDNVRSKYENLSFDSLISQAIPQVAEYKIDGSRLGLSRNLSIDVFLPTYMVVDYKTGSRKHFHKLATTGYALVLEAELEVEVNVGAIIYIWFNGDNLPFLRTEYYYIGDEHRREFLETRDALIEIIEHSRDPGMPVRCYPYCPYRKICWRDKS